MAPSHRRVVACVLGTIATSVAWIGALSGQSAGGSGASSLTVCVGPDSALRVTSADGRCAAGLRPTVVAAGPGWRSGSRGEAAPPSETLTDLGRRIEALENRSGFEVVDRAGRPILRVAPDGVRVYNTGGKEVAAIHVEGGGGSFTARSADGLLATTFGVSGARAGLWVSEGGVVRADAGRRPVGNYALRVLSNSGATVAAIGESNADTGAILIGDANERVRISLQLGAGRALFNLINRGGAPIASLSEDASEAGMFQIGNAASDPMVKMDVSKSRYGVVLTGPVAGLPLVPSSGLPGSYLLGCGAGVGCRP
jgi:hypothetical protein